MMALNQRFALLATVIVALSVGRLSSRPAAMQLDRMAVTLPGAGIRLGGVLVRPDAAGPRPAIILLHGFQPAGTNGAALMAPMAVRFAALGYVALALSMRGWPPSEGADDCGLRQPDDVAAALEWLAGQSGVDPNRLGIVGLSQGGQVALLAGARSKRVRAIIAAYPVTDVERWKETTAFPGIPGYINRVCEPGGAARRSPVTLAADISAPVLLIHGESDTRVPTEQTTLMRDALRRAGRDVETVLVPGMAHGFSILQNPASREPLLAFLAKTIGAE
jgi:dipeptidyl aminopeptidase/acylaminoacyl peptidase